MLQQFRVKIINAAQMQELKIKFKITLNIKSLVKLPGSSLLKNLNDHLHAFNCVKSKKQKIQRLSMLK